VGSSSTSRRARTVAGRGSHPRGGRGRGGGRCRLQNSSAAARRAVAQGRGWVGVAPRRTRAEWGD
jgi:hypothetical protein